MQFLEMFYQTPRHTFRELEAYAALPVQVKQAYRDQGQT